MGNLVLALPLLRLGSWKVSVITTYCFPSSSDEHVHLAETGRLCKVAKHISLKPLGLLPCLNMRMLKQQAGQRL